jgi:hypothetical protein
LPTKYNQSRLLTDGNAHPTPAILATAIQTTAEGRQPSWAHYGSYIVSVIQTCKGLFSFTVTAQPTAEIVASGL